MNVLITGSNGFIGSAVVKEMRKEHFVIGCGRRDCSAEEVELYVKWDIGHDDIPGGLLDMRIDAVVHTASCKSTEDSDLELSYANILGTHRVINLCKQKSCKKAILFSSLPILQNSVNKPIVENAPYAPHTMYHATKAAQELMFLQLEKTGTKLVILRIPSPIAPHMQEKTIFTIFGNRAIKNEPIMLNGKGTRRQNYIDIRDIASACGKILLSDIAEGIYNIGAEKTISNIQLAEKWIDVTGSKSEILFSGNPDPADGQDWMADLSRLKKDIGYRQMYDIEQTMLGYMEEKRNAE